MVCNKKNCSGQMGYFGPEIAHPRNSRSALRIFLKFYWMKGADRYMKSLLVVFQEKIWGN